MSLLDILQDRMVKVMPLPEPSTGPRTARIRLKAAVVAGPLSGTPTAPAHQEQTGYAIQSMQEGAHLARVDSNPTVWNNAQAWTWRFSATADATQGAQNAWLDLWGKTLQQPRMTGEVDTNYAKRILNNAIAPVTTNFGMAATIDANFGTTGTAVLEAASFFIIVRLNNNTRLNAGHRLNSAGATADLSACFVVKLGSSIPSPFQPSDIQTATERLKAAGTRCVGIIQFYTWVQPGWVDPNWVS